MHRTPEQTIAFAVRCSHEVRLPYAVPHGKINGQSPAAQAKMILDFLRTRPAIEQAYAYYLYGNAGEKLAAAETIAAFCTERLKKLRLRREQIETALHADTVRSVSKLTGLTQYKSWRLRQMLADELAEVRGSLARSVESWLKQMQRESCKWR